MDCPGFEHFHHQADVGVRGFGRTPGEAFEQAALALAAVVCDPGRVEASERVDIACAAPDLELLLVDWLAAIVSQAGARRMLFSRFAARIDPGQEGFTLAGAAWGEALDRKRHQPKVEVKAATYHLLRVAQTPDGTWLAQTVLDV